MSEIKLDPKIEKIIHFFKIVIGSLAILVGVLGIIFPILPGWILIFVGLELLGIKIILIDNIKEYIKNKIEEEKNRKRNKKEGK